MCAQCQKDIDPEMKFFLYGSAAIGCALKTSDVDVSLLGGPLLS